MLKNIFSFFFFFLFFNFQSFAQADLSSCSLFDETALLRHVKSLSSDAFQGRGTGTKGAIKTQKYIVNQFHTLKVLPFGEHYNQSFSFNSKRELYEAVNILGIVKGTKKPKKYIVISAHYDHLGVKYGEIYNGADDNASGIAALFSFAEYFKKHPPKHTVILAAFDAEELGLQGSRYFVNNMKISKKDIVVNINLDMISRSDKNELYVVGTPKNKTFECIVKNTHASKKMTLLTGHDGEDGFDNWTYASDHANFYKKNIPFLYFGVEDHKDYHEPTDDYENIQPEFYIEAVKFIISVFKDIDNSKF